VLHTEDARHVALVRWLRVLSPAATHRAVDMLKKTLGMSERLACRAVGLARSTYRTLPMAQTPADPDAELRAWLRGYATKNPCHGFRRAWAVLRYYEAVRSTRSRSTGCGGRRDCR